MAASGNQTMWSSGDKDNLGRDDQHLAIQRLFRRAGMLVLGFPVLAFAAYLASVILQQHPFLPPSLFPLVFWPIGVPFLCLFVVSGLGLLRQRRWAATLAVITLALLLLAEWATSFIMLTPLDWLSFSRLPALGWIGLAVLALAATGVLTGRKWMLNVAGLALLTLAIVVWAYALAVSMVVGPGFRGSVDQRTSQEWLTVVVLVAIAVLSNSVLLAYPVAMLAAFARWRLLATSADDSA